MDESMRGTEAPDGLRYQTREGAFCAVMQGGGETYLSAFALLFQANAFQLGLLSALPPLVGTLSQLLSVKVLSQIKARRPVILSGAIGQAAAWLPVFLLPLLFPAHGASLLLVGAMICLAMGHFTVPAWNSLITDIVDEDQRGLYFARRAKIVGVVSFIALAAAGLVLYVSESWSRPAVGFAVVFAGAAFARLISAAYLAKLREPIPAGQQQERRLLDFLRHEPNRMFRRFLLFSGAFHAAANVAGPFFVLYLLRDLHLSYLTYGVWLAAPIIGQFITLKEWGRLGDRFGNKQVLLVTGLIVPFIPMLYLCSEHWVFLVLINFMSGVTWSGFSLALQNYVFDVVPRPDRATGVALNNALNACGIAAGALLGSWLATITPPELLLADVSIPMVSNLPIVFFISGLLRLLVSITMLKTFREGRTVTPISPAQFVCQMPLIKPVMNLLGVTPATLSRPL